jgi:putative membrane protein
VTTSLRWTLAFHLLAVISWMAGQLYLYRLFVYHAMEQEGVVRQRLELMERRLLRGIATPAMLVAGGTGLAMLRANWAYYVSQPWMWVKLAAVLGLLGWHGLAAHYRRELAEGRCRHDDRFFRVMNEVPTVFMVAVVVMVIVRPFVP